jgi:threonine dehydrogenase-like Zn-dependent dehydrogenase
MDNTMSKNRAVTFTGYQKAELLEYEPDSSALGDLQIEAKTLASLISPGTEINASYNGSKFPVARTGYAAVSEIVKLGSGVKGFAVGDRVMHMSPHQSLQRTDASICVRLPTGLPAQVAVFSRLMGVSMSTLITTRARPGATVLVTGLGPVGNLAAQIFQSCGYRVIGVDPSASRRDLANRVGIERVLEKAGPELADQISIGIDCSGHEQAVLDVSKLLKIGGELVLIGVPWKKRTDLPAFDLLHTIFHRYVTVRSGWEWELPVHPAAFGAGSIMENFETALRWLDQGRVKVEGLYETRRPEEAQTAYQRLLKQEAMGVVFDWAK